MFLTFVCAPVFINFLYKLHIVRKISTDFSALVGDRHLKAGTPIMGGLLVVFATLILTLLLNNSPDTLFSITIFSVLALMGGLDDVLNIYGHKRVVWTVRRQLQVARVHKNILRRIWLIITLPWCFYLNVWYELGSYPGNGVQAGEKILIQLLGAGLIAWWAYAAKGITILSIPLFGAVNIGIFFPILVVIAVIAMSNAVNITDGMDGLSSGLLIFAFLALFIIAILEQDWGHATTSGVVIGSLLSFLYFNIKPARVQMGDAGSLSLGALLAILAVLQGKIVLLPIIGVVFVAEVASSLIQAIYRRFFGKRLFKMAPLHLHFQIQGWSEEKVVMRFWLFGLMAAFIGIWLNFV